MGIDFTPNIGEYKTMGSFKMWCQKMLPAVYDDSLSYFETLCKVTKYLNDLIDNQNNLVTDYKGLYEAYNQLQDWVNTYFDNLDVQKEINNKLDEMAKNGTLTNVVSSFFSEYKKVVDSVVETQNTTIEKIGDDVVVLKNRMDTFSSLPSGSTAGNAELEDIRVGYNGYEYANAGGAVRGQIKDARDYAKSIFNTCANAISNKVVGTNIKVDGALNRPLLGLSVYGKTIQEAKVGKNLINVDAMTNKNMVRNEDGSYTITRTGSTSSDRFSEWFFVNLPAGRYTISAKFISSNIEGEDVGYLNYYVRYSDGSVVSGRILQTGYSVQTIVPSKEIVAIRLFIGPTYPVGSYCRFSDLQLEIGGEATSYVPYLVPSPEYPQPFETVGVGNTIVIDCSNEETKENSYLTVIAPNGLPGIPVPSGGNYTDDNGQKWICDEIDYGRGVYIKRIGVNVFTGGEDYIFKSSAGNNRFLANDPYEYSSEYWKYARCSHMTQNGSSYFRIGDLTQIIWQFPSTFANTLSEFREWLREQLYNGTPMTVMGVLATPVVTNLGEQIIGNYPNLKIYDGVTTINNNSNVTMKVSYVVDTKSYIDSKFEELANAIIATGAYA